MIDLQSSHSEKRQLYMVIQSEFDALAKELSSAMIKEAKASDEPVEDLQARMGVLRKEIASLKQKVM